MKQAVWMRKRAGRGTLLETKMWQSDAEDTSFTTPCSIRKNGGKSLAGVIQSILLEIQVFGQSTLLKWGRDTNPPSKRQKHEVA